MGLKGALAERGVDHTLALEPVGNAAVKDTVVDRIQRLFLQHQPHVVTGILGAPILRHVTHFLRDNETPILVNNLGADPLLDGSDPNPWIFHNSFNLWQSMYALGYWAAREMGIRACVASAFHEAGYGLVTAFWNGFTEAGGGTIVATEVTHRERSDDDPGPALQRLADLDPDFIVGLYSGREGVSFAGAYAALGLDTPLVASPLMFHERWRSQMTADFPGAKTVFSWDRQGHDAAHRRFLSACEAVDTRTPDLFALLGYEAGHALAGLAEQPEALSEGPDAILGALAGSTFPSPRGNWTLDPRGRHVVTTDHLLDVQVGDEGPTELRALETLELPARYQSDHDAFKSQEVRPGWINPYLVT